MARKVITVTAYADYLKAHSAMGSRQLIDGWEVVRVVELPTIPMSWEIHIERPDRRSWDG